MGILDFFGGGDQQPAQDPSFAALRELGLPQGLLDAYQKEQEQNRRMQAMQMVIGGIGNAVSGYQGMAPVAAPSIGASGGAGGGSGGIGGIDGLVDRAMKFSQLREGIAKQQSMAQIRQAISADTRLSDVERKAYLTNPEAYLKLVESDVARRSAPDDIEIKYDGDGRVVGAFNKKTQAMLSPEDLAKRNINMASGLSQAKTWDMEDSLRKEYTGAGETKRYVEADPIFRSMVKSASNDTGAADLDLVYGIGKIMDPGSVVREGEMVMVNKASPFAEMLQGYIGSIQGQGKLTPETRSRLLEMARTRMGELRMAHDEITGGITSRAKERGIDPNRVLSRQYEALPDAPIYSPNARGFIPQEAIVELRSNPTPAEIAQFETVFGQGTARRVLGGR